MCKAKYYMLIMKVVMLKSSWKKILSNEQITITNTRLVTAYCTVDNDSILIQKNVLVWNIRYKRSESSQKWRIEESYERVLEFDAINDFVSLLSAIIQNFKVSVKLVDMNYFVFFASSIFKTTRDLNNRQKHLNFNP